MNVPFVIVTFVGLLLPMFAPHKNHTLGRRMFWSGLTVAVASAFFIAFPPDWKSGAQLSALVAFMMLVTAYFTSPYLKFRGKIFAAFTVDVEAENPVRRDGDTRAGARRRGTAQDGLLTSARKLWWLMVPAMALCTFNIGHYLTARENPRLAVAMAIAVVVLSAGFGFGDARADLPIARGQRLQFVLVSIATAGVFTIVYLGAYASGKRGRLRDGGSAP